MDANLSQVYMQLMALPPHMAELNCIPETMQSEEYPKGTLILVIQAVRQYWLIGYYS